LFALLNYTALNLTWPCFDTKANAIIEGCSLSETDTRVLIENNITAHGKPLSDHLRVKDHYNAFLKIREDAKTKRELSIDFIKELNSCVMQSTGGNVHTISGDDIIKLTADIHYNLINIHPFGDGNGRTARLLMNYIQMYHGEPLIKVFTEDRAAYINALNETEEKENPEVFREFICRQQIKFLEAELVKFHKKGSGFTMLF
jgi:Fic family protein